MALRTVKAPAVVRFRPQASTTNVARDAAISVRFTQSMDRVATRNAFSVTVDGKAIAGKVTFAENDSVLIFDPSSTLPYGATVVATVAATATSADGVVDGRRHEGHVQGESRSRAVKRSDQLRRRRRTAAAVEGGGSVGGGTWGAVERYYLDLMNCTRTGGLVTSGGDCSSPGGRSVAPLSSTPASAPRSRGPYAQEAGRQQHVHPLQRRQPGRSPAPRRLHQLSLGGEPRLPLGQPVQRGPGQPSLLPERAVVEPQRRPLREPDERAPTTASGSACGCRAAGCAWSSTSTTRRGTFGLVPSAAGTAHDAPMLRNAVLHLANEQPLLADLFEMPTSGDVDRAPARISGRSMANGRSSSTTLKSVFVFPYHRVTFIEIPPQAALSAEMGDAIPVPVAVGAPGRMTRRTPPTTASSRSTRTSSAGSARSDRALRARPGAPLDRPAPDTGCVKDPVLHSRPCPRTS